VLQVFASASTVNVSHHIESVSFGPQIPGMTNPLDGYTRILKTEQESGTFKYFIKVRLFPELGFEETLT
jgi:hypothetical protein